MNPDLERLIRLQHLYLDADDARRSIGEMPGRALALEARIETARVDVESAKARLADSQAARRAIEKDLAAIQTRLSKYRDQLMEVKTNREYQAMQKEIEVAQTEVSGFEDKVLERMIESDELTRAVKAAESALGAEQSAVAGERNDLEREQAALEAALDENTAARERLVVDITPEALAAFETLARGRKGVAMAEARNGHCTICHVRLRPQVYNEVRRNEALIRCDSCQRILYFDAASTAALASSAGAPR
jgi:predicted  nucleic acid-binding Zn-ribbon protein